MPIRYLVHLNQLGRVEPVPKWLGVGGPIAAICTAACVRPGGMKSTTAPPFRSIAIALHCFPQLHGPKHCLGTHRQGLVRNAGIDQLLLSLPWLRCLRTSPPYNPECFGFCTMSTTSTSPLGEQSYGPGRVVPPHTSG